MIRRKFAAIFTAAILAAITTPPSNAFAPGVDPPKFETVSFHGHPTAPIDIEEATLRPCYYNFRWNKKELLYSYNGAHRYFGNVVQAVRDWNATDSGITIKPATPGARGDLEFIDINQKTGFYASAYVPTHEVTTELPSASTSPTRIQIAVNQDIMDRTEVKATRNGGDFLKTYTISHELGHALGLAHTDKDCGLSGVESIMRNGGKYLVTDTPNFNSPRKYDRLELKKLYAN